MGKPTLESIIDNAFDLARVMRHIMASVTKDGEPVNALQIFALAAIEGKEGMTMRELADCLYVTSPTATSFMNRLVKLGWVRRTRDKRNRRIVRISLTERGRAVLERKKAKRAAMIRRILGLLTVKEQRDLAHIIDKLHRASADFAIH